MVGVGDAVEAAGGHADIDLTERELSWLKDCRPTGWMSEGELAALVAKFGLTLMKYHSRWHVHTTPPPWWAEAWRLQETQQPG